MPIARKGGQETGLPVGVAGPEEDLSEPSEMSWTQNALETQDHSSKLQSRRPRVKKLSGLLFTDPLTL